MDEFLIDSHKLIYHPERVSDLQKAGRNWDKYKNLKPIYAEISSSGACNHRCTFCSVDYIGYKSIMLDRNILKKFFESAETIGLKAVMFAGDGEPLLNPEIEQIVKDAEEHNIATSFTSNGVHLKETFLKNAISNIAWIKISMNAGTAQAYQKIHRTQPKDFEKVWDNLTKAISIRNEYRKSTGGRGPALGIQSLILPDNINTLESLATRAEETGMDYLVLKPYVHNVYMEQEGYENLDYTREEYKETIDKLQKKFKKSRLSIISRKNALEKLIGNTPRYQKCYSTPALWFYISGDGNVYSCGAHVGNENFLLGNIKEESIKNIWQSQERKKCMNYVLDELNLESCRRTCRMDEANNYLSNLLEEKVEHMDFI